MIWARVVSTRGESYVVNMDHVQRIEGNRDGKGAAIIYPDGSMAFVATDYKTLQDFVLENSNAPPIP